MAFSGSLNFISASDFGAYYGSPGGPRVWGGPNSIYGANRGWVPVDFAGLNTLINEPMDLTTNKLGHPADTKMKWVYGTDTAYVGGVRGRYFTHYASLTDTVLEAAAFNSLILHRNGPYQHPSWKQIRGGDHPIARRLRLNNTMSIEVGAWPYDHSLVNPVKREHYKRIRRERNERLGTVGYAEYEKTIHNAMDVAKASGLPLGALAGTELYLSLPPNIRQFYEPVLTTKHKPFLFEIPAGTETAKVRTTLMNNMMDFSSHDLNNLLRLASGDPTTGSEQNQYFERRNQKQYGLLHIATDHGGQNFIYSERIYPREINSYRDYKLERPGYEEVPGAESNGYDRSGSRSFWRRLQIQGGNTKLATSDGTSRLRTDALATSSLGVVQDTSFTEDLSFYSSSARQLISASAGYLSGTYNYYGNLPSQSFGRSVTSVSGASTLGIKSHIVEYANNGVVKNRLEILHSSGALSQLDSYQPYQISLLSMWPLDPKHDVYEGGKYLTSSFGGQGVQIGLTPHKEATMITSHLQSHNFLAANLATGTFVNSFLSPLQTSSAGELVYSTKPTIFFWKNGVEHITSSVILHSDWGDHLKFLDHGLTMGGRSIPVESLENKLELRDAQGNVVAFHFVSGSMHHDGRVMDEAAEHTSGSTFVEVGVDDVSSTQHLFQRLAGAVNAVNTYNNGLTLNISASFVSKSARSDQLNRAAIIEFHQTTYGTGQAFSFSHETSSHPSSGHRYDLKYNFHSAAFHPGGQPTYWNAPINPVTSDQRFGVDPNPSMIIQGSASALQGDAIMGYRYPSASIQYHRHTFPYNTPFYATNRIRQRDPFHNAYSTFGENLKYFGRDHSLVPEYRYSEHMDYYSKTYSFERGKRVYRPMGAEITGPPAASGIKQTSKIIRTKLNAAAAPFSQGKADSITLDGANITSSAKEEKYSLSSTRYRYDDINGAQLATTTAPSEYSYLSDQGSVDFEGKYGISDSVVNFSSLLDQQNAGFKYDVNTVPNEIRFRSSIVKKLLPYNGLYPVVRTTQIAKSFKETITSEDTYNPTMSAPPPTWGDDEVAQAGLQALIEPFMAPGLLYNSIKSGIAVDYPVYFQSPKYYCPHQLINNLANDLPTDNGVGEATLSASYHGALSMLGAGRVIPSILTQTASIRLPFKSLYDPQTTMDALVYKDKDTGEKPLIHLVSDFFDLDRHEAGGWEVGRHLSGTIVTGQPTVQLPDLEDWASIERGTYFPMINNFLSETMEFFLETLDMGTKLPVVVAPYSKKQIGMKKEVSYLMEVSLKMGKYQVMAEGPRDASIGFNSASSGFNSQNNDHGYFLRNSTMRGYIYGPPMEIVPMYNAAPGTRVGIPESSWHPKMGKEIHDSFINISDYASYFAANLQDPAYHAFTPPYFYGKSSFVYNLFHTDTNFEGPAPSGMQTIDLINNIVQFSSSFYVDKYERAKFGKHAGVGHPYKISQHSLSLMIPNTASVSKGSNTKMHIDASVELFPEPVSLYTYEYNTNTIDDISTSPVVLGNPMDAWYIAPHWVCPVLDFSSSIAAVSSRHPKQGASLDSKNPNDYNHTITTVTNSFHDITTGRGLWGGYGTDPYDNLLINETLVGPENDKKYVSGKGIWLEISDFSVNTSINHLQEATTEFLTNQDNDSHLGYASLALGQENDSLADLLNIEKTRYPIGKFAEQKIVYEAVVLIPYVDKRIDIRVNSDVDYFGGADKQSVYTTREIIPGRHFLPINESVFENILSLHIMEKTHSPPERLLSGLYGTLLDSYSNKVAAGQTNTNAHDWLFNARHEATMQTDIGRMIAMLSSYSDHGGFVLPPEFDFMHRKEVAPFQMIVIPCVHALQKQELVDIYQGVMPQSTLQSIKEDFGSFVDPDFRPLYSSLYVPHAAEANFLMGEHITNFLSPRPAMPQLVAKDDVIFDQDSITPYKNSREFYKNLRFMVFKVKQRAKKDYGNYRLSQIAKAIQNEAFTENNELLAASKYRSSLRDRKHEDIYGANWPYDYFSFIETAKLDIEIEVAE